MLLHYYYSSAFCMAHLVDSEHTYNMHYNKNLTMSLVGSGVCGKGRQYSGFTV